MNDYKKEIKELKEKQQKENEESKEKLPNLAQMDLPFADFDPALNSQDSASNLLNIQDSFPIYSTTSAEMTALKKKRGRNSILPRIRSEFLLKRSHKKTEKLKITITPALIYHNNDEYDAEMFYPTANEQIIEQILRLFLIRQKDNAFYISDDETMVFFTIQDIKKELKSLGKTKNHTQIVHSLEVLRGTTIKVCYGDSSFHDESLLTAFGFNHKIQKYYVRFCSTIHKSIRNINQYTQFDYRLTFAKKGKTQLAIWVVTQMFLHFKNADRTNHMSLSFKYVRDSSLLLKATEEKQQVRTLRNTFKQLISTDKEALEQESNFREIDLMLGSKRKSNPQYTDYPIAKVKEIKVGKDICFQIYPSDIFINAVISSNKRTKLIKNA